MESFAYYRAERITNRVTRIFGPAEELMYLVEGSERSALIDTGPGVGDLKGFVEGLTDKPYFVLLTHGHVDHAMGAPAFDEVYMNAADLEVYTAHSDLSVRKGYLQMIMGERYAMVQEEDFVPIQSGDRYKPLLPGDRFDLGGIHLEICEGAGHTPGMVTILLVEERTLLLGDACNYTTFLFDEHALGLRTYKQILMELEAKTKGRYDQVYLSHGSGDAPKEMLASVISVCEDILAGRVDDVPFHFMNHTAFLAKATDHTMRRLDGGLGNVIYSKEKIHL